MCDVFVIYRHLRHGPRTINLAAMRRDCGLSRRR